MATIEIVFTVGLLFFLVIIFGMILGHRKIVTKPKLKVNVVFRIVGKTSYSLTEYL